MRSGLRSALVTAALTTARLTAALSKPITLHTRPAAIHGSTASMAMMRHSVVPTPKCRAEDRRCPAGELVGEERQQGRHVALEIEHRARPPALG